MESEQTMNKLYQDIKKGGFDVKAKDEQNQKF